MLSGGSEPVRARLKSLVARSRASGGRCGGGLSRTVVLEGGGAEAEVVVGVVVVVEMRVASAVGWPMAVWVGRVLGWVRVVSV